MDESLVLGRPGEDEEGLNTEGHGTCETCEGSRLFCLLFRYRGNRSVCLHETSIRENSNSDETNHILRVDFIVVPKVIFQTLPPFGILLYKTEGELKYLPCLWQKSPVSPLFIEEVARSDGGVFEDK